MSIRTAVSNVTFQRPFRLPNMDRAYPAGRYAIETEQETLDQVSLLAYRRIATRIHLVRPGLTEVLTIDPAHLQDALSADLTDAG